jgi:hypothetical protein
MEFAQTAHLFIIQHSELLPLEGKKKEGKITKNKQELIQSPGSSKLSNFVLQQKA